jgi:hypothetical protein
MAYRRDEQAARSWYLWLDDHRDALVRCGLPAFAYADEARWLRFLGHDGWDAETGWNVEMLTIGQAARLFEFVAREYGHERYRGLLRVLSMVTGRVST